jgi:hypothetical protein
VIVTSIRSLPTLGRYYVTGHVVFPPTTLFASALQVPCSQLSGRRLRWPGGVWAPDRLCGLGKPPRPRAVLLVSCRDTLGVGGTRSERWCVWGCWVAPFGSPARLFPFSSWGSGLADRQTANGAGCTVRWACATIPTVMQ